MNFNCIFTKFHSFFLLSHYYYYIISVCVVVSLIVCVVFILISIIVQKCNTKTSPLSPQIDQNIIYIFFLFSQILSSSPGFIFALVSVSEKQTLWYMYVKMTILHFDASLYKCIHIIINFMRINKFQVNDSCFFIRSFYQK